MAQYPLVQGKWTTAQLVVAGLWAANLFAVLILWATTSGVYFGATDKIYGSLLAFGQLSGLLATYFALVQFMLMGRVKWVERPFGLDHLAHFHRLNGYATIIAIVIHPILVVMAYSISRQSNFPAEYLATITNLPYVWMALISEILFVAVAGTSVYIVRRHLKFETWYYVHFMVYAAIVLAFFHQFALGGSLNGHPLARGYWYALYIFVAINVLYWRFGVSTLNLLRFRFQVSRVVAETPTTTSIYIRGRGLDRFKIRPGQYVLIRILAWPYIKDEHPFSVSRLVTNSEFRITVRDVGDYTNALRSLKPGAFVLTAGPFGRFTNEVAATDKRLFIAGGVGITPIRLLAEEAVQQQKDSVLLYGSRTSKDVVLKSEIDDLAEQGLTVVHVLSEQAQSANAENGSIDVARIERLVPDYKERDIYLCGPPRMVEPLIQNLTGRGVTPERLHYERFQLHN